MHKIIVLKVDQKYFIYKCSNFTNLHISAHTVKISVKTKKNSNKRENIPKYIIEYFDLLSGYLNI